MDNFFIDYTTRLNDFLNKTEFTNDKQMNLGQQEGLSSWVHMTKKVKAENKAIYFIGNGASAAMASHMSADACKNGHLKAYCLSDTALITAISNDVEYNSVYSLQLERYASPGDLLITISSSGNSPNVVKAICIAKEIKMNVVTLSGFKPDNKSRLLGDLNVYIPADRYGLAESGHQAILHCWLDCYLNSIGVDI